LGFGGWGFGVRGKMAKCPCMLEMLESFGLYLSRPKLNKGLPHENVRACAKANNSRTRLSPAAFAPHTPHPKR
jgi:hypothetical protein